LVVHLGVLAQITIGLASIRQRRQ